MERWFWILSWKNALETFSRVSALLWRDPVKVLTNVTGFGCAERLVSKSVADVIIDSRYLTIGLWFHDIKLIFHDSEQAFHGSKWAIHDSKMTFHGSKRAVHGTKWAFHGTIPAFHDSNFSFHDSKFSIHHSKRLLFRTKSGQQQPPSRAAWSVRRLLNLVAGRLGETAVEPLKLNNFLIFNKINFYAKE